MDIKKIERAIQQTWGAVAEDCGQTTLSGAVEVACDAERPVKFGYITQEEWKEFTDLGWKEMQKIGRRILKGSV